MRKNIKNKESKILDKSKSIIKRVYNHDNLDKIPNKEVNTAIITGIGITNDEILKPQNIYKLMEIGNESLYIWTYKKNTNSNIITVVNPEILKKNIRKTSASILEIAFAIGVNLEYLETFGYKRIYNFNHNIDIENQIYKEDEYYMNESRNIKSFIDIYNVVQIIDLLIRDDKYFISCQNLCSAKMSHNFCLQCAFTPDHKKKHIDKEPEIRDYIKILPNMEIAIVNSTRSIETILGQPGNKQDPKKLEKIKEKWKYIIGINPDNIFQISGMSYIDFYYEVFEKRRFAAHSFGKLNFDLQRNMTIKIQSFAWKINMAYFKKNKKTLKEGIKNIKFNINLYNKLPKDLSTNQTKK